MLPTALVRLPGRHSIGVSSPSCETNSLAVASLQAHERGYAFEAFLKRSFDMAGLTVREPFRNTGEQIDGSFLLGEETYLFEAKWHALPTGVTDLHVFHGKLEKRRPGLQSFDHQRTVRHENVGCRRRQLIDCECFLGVIDLLVKRFRPTCVLRRFPSAEPEPKVIESDE